MSYPGDQDTLVPEHAQLFWNDAGTKPGEDRLTGIGPDQDGASARRDGLEQTGEANGLIAGSVVNQSLPSRTTSIA